LLDQLDKINVELNVLNAKNNREFIEKRYIQAREDLSKAEDSLKDFQIIYGVSPDLQVKAAAQTEFSIESELKAEEVKLDVLKKILSPDQIEVKTQEAKIAALRDKMTQIQNSTDVTDFLRLGNSPNIAMSFLRLQRERFISIISLISCLGVTIGVMALIVVLAVMTGFDNDLKDKIIGANPHIVIHSEDGIANFDVLSQKIKILKGVKDVAPYVSGQAFLYYKDKVLSLNLKGIDVASEQRVTRIKDYIEGGKLELPHAGIVIGKELALILGLKKGDKVQVIVKAVNVLLAK